MRTALQWVVQLEVGSILYTCTVGQKKKKTKHPYLFQCNLPYTKETGTNHHGLLSTLI